MDTAERHVSSQAPHLKTSSGSVTSSSVSVRQYHASQHLPFNPSNNEACRPPRQTSGTQKSPLRSASRSGRTGRLAATYHQSPRYRQYLGDDVYLSDSRAHPQPDQLVSDRPLRSYRDTTSEIISMYGSNYQPVYLTESMPTHEDTPRACSQNQLHQVRVLSNTSANALNLPANKLSLQRTRSPAQYPTRLKRPGVGSASPALAENGTIDYSRMVEVDRVSQRTTYGSYKPTYPHTPRRPPPLTLRMDPNRPGTSLGSQSAPGLSNYNTVSGRSRTPNSSVSWNSRPSDRYCRASTDQSTRSASLTSIVEMYQRPLTSSSTCPPSRTAGSFYYDYSEEFDERLRGNANLGAPICPVPQRFTGNDQPLVLRGESEHALDAGIRDERSKSDTCHHDSRQSSHDGGSEASYESYLQGAHDESIRDIEKVIANAISKMAQGDAATCGSAVEDGEKRQCVGLDDVDNDLWISSRKDTRMPSLTMPRHRDSAEHCKESALGAWRRSKTLGAGSGLAAAELGSSHSQGNLSRIKYALDPTFADFTSLLSSFERLAKSPFSRLSDDEGADSDDHKRLSKHLTLQLFDGGTLETEAFRKRHRRNRATTRIDKAGFSSNGSSDNTSSADDEDGLSPKPLSPSRKMSSRGRHPLLMKALPPLPKEDDSGISAKTSQSGEESGPVDLCSQFTRGQDIRPERPTDESGLPSATSSARKGRQSPFRLRLRANTSSSSVEMEGLDGLDAKISQQLTSLSQCQPDAAARPPKLRLKMSRNKFGQPCNEKLGAITRSDRLKQCNSLADLAQAPLPPGSVRKASGGKDSMETQPLCARHSLETIEDESYRPETSPQPSDPFNLSYPPTTPLNSEALRPSTSTLRNSTSELRSSKSDLGPSAHRGLKKKFSQFRLRVTGTTASISPWSTRPSNELTTKSVGTARTRQEDVTATASDSSAGEKALSVSAHSDHVALRVKRWASDARRAVRSYVRRTLIRSTR